MSSCASLWLALLALPALAAPQSIHPGDRTLSEPLRKALRVVRGELAAVPSGRHLLAVTAEIPVVERRRQKGPAVRFQRGPEPAFVLDKDRAEDLSELGFELLFLRAHWLAASRIPIDLVDSELAARQAVLAYALEKTELRADFGRRLRKASDRVENTLRQRRRMRDFALRGDEDAAILYPGERPARPLDCLAFDLRLFAEDPELFYESVEGSVQLSSAAVSLTELTDFLELYSDQLDRVDYAALGRTALVEGRAYPGRVARAASRVRDEQGLSMIREGLGLFRSTGKEELLKKVNAWVRKGE